MKDGVLENLMVDNAHLVNTDNLSEEINLVYDEYDALDSIEP